MNHKKIKSIEIHELKPEEIPNSRLRKTIYHYTSPEGLYGMISQGTIRFTDCQFLNDKSEYIHIRDVLFEAIEELKRDAKIRPDVIETVQDLYNNNYETEEVVIDQSQEINQKLHIKYAYMRYYVFCTSLDDDSLSMWNYYVKSSKYEGYNLAFTNQEILNMFRNASNDITLYHGQVNYSHTEQKEFLKMKLLQISDSFDKADPNLSDEELLENFYEYKSEEIYHLIQDYRLFFKNEKFSHEKEYRFVIKIPRDFKGDVTHNINPGFAVKHGILCPHYDLSINRLKSIKGIKIGPMLEHELAKDGLTRYLSYHGYEKSIPITQSDVPIRY